MRICRLLDNSLDASPKSLFRNQTQYLFDQNTETTSIEAKSGVGEEQSFQLVPSHAGNRAVSCCTLLCVAVSVVVPVGCDKLCGVQLAHHSPAWSLWCPLQAVDQHHLFLVAGVMLWCIGCLKIHTRAHTRMRAYTPCFHTTRFALLLLLYQCNSSSELTLK